MYVADIHYAPIGRALSIDGLGFARRAVAFAKQIGEAQLVVGADFLPRKAQ